MGTMGACVNACASATDMDKPKNRGKRNMVVIWCVNNTTCGVRKMRSKVEDIERVREVPETWPMTERPAEEI